MYLKCPAIIVVAAGNGGFDGIGDNNDSIGYFPCNFTHSNLICVAALEQDYDLASFSNFGANTVDVGIG